MVKTRIDYKGQLRCELTHRPSGSKIQTDAPVDNHGRGETFSPTDLLASSLGACMLTILGIVAEQRKLDVTGANASVEKFMSDDQPRRVDKLVVELMIPLSENHPERKILESAALSCPVAHSLSAEIDVKVDFIWSMRDMQL